MKIRERLAEALRWKLFSPLIFMLKRKNIFSLLSFNCLVLSICSSAGSCKEGWSGNKLMKNC